MKEERIPIHQAATTDEERGRIAMYAKYGKISIQARQAKLKYRAKVMVGPASSAILEGAKILPDGTQVLSVGNPIEKEESNFEIPSAYWGPGMFGDPTRDLWSIGCDRMVMSEGGYIEVIDVSVPSTVLQGKPPKTPREQLQSSTPKLPRLSEARLNRWWEGLTDSDRGQSFEKLEEMCRQKFTQFHIARQRIRDLDPGRKRGPKPISRKTTAE